MKISKLFHWLYAILMLLPFLIFLPNAFYYGFNKEAVAQEKTEQVPVYYETNVVNSINDLTIGNVYSWIDNAPIITRSSVLDLCNIKILKGDIYGLETTLRIAPSGNVYYPNSTNVPIVINERYLDFVITDLLRINEMPIELLPSFTKCNTQYTTGEYQPLVTSMSITDSLSYAWDSVWQNDLFSWSYGSFLTEPFIYIGNVFNVPVDNTLYYALSYWLDISIIWLCFDVIMYVPLLVHRWLDKGIVE